MSNGKTGITPSTAESSIVTKPHRTRYYSDMGELNQIKNIEIHKKKRCAPKELLPNSSSGQLNKPQ